MNEGVLPKIVFCADRLISAEIQFEHGQPKIYRLTESTYVMMASSDSLKSDMIVKSTINSIETKHPSAHEVVTILANECKNIEQNEREKNVLSKFGLDYESFIEKSRSMSQDFMRIVTSELENYDSGFRSQFLIFGLDPNPHIYIVEQDGSYKLHDFVGFAVVGSGFPLAFADMTKYMYHPSVSLAAALVRVYNAKKIAERIGSVGKMTDLYVLHMPEQDGKQNVQTWWVPDEVMKILDDGIQTVKDQELETYVDIMKNIDKFFDKETAKTNKEKNSEKPKGN